MQKKYFKLIPFILILIIFSLNIYSVAPVTTITNIQGQASISGLFFNSYKYGENIEFEWHYFNSSGYPKNISNNINCGIHIYKNSKETGNYAGGHIFTNNNVITTSNIYDWEQKILSGNFTENNNYRVLIYCKDGQEGAYYEQFFEVTKTGEIKDTKRDLFLLLTFTIIISIFTLLVHIFKNDEGATIFYGFFGGTTSFLFSGLLILNKMFILDQWLNKFIIMLFLCWGIYLFTIAYVFFKNYLNSKKEGRI